MESTELIETNNHFLASSLKIKRDDHNDQSSSPLSECRRSEAECRRSESAIFLPPVFDETSSSALGRQFSVSRSGRYKSKTKQRMSLFNNGCDFTNSSPIVLTDDTIKSTKIVEPPTITCVDEPLQLQENSSQQTGVETLEADESKEPLQPVQMQENSFQQTDVENVETRESDESKEPIQPDQLQENSSQQTGVETREADELKEPLQPVQIQENSFQQTDVDNVETREVDESKADELTVEEIAETSLTSSEEVDGDEEVQKPPDESCLPAPSDAADEDICLELELIAEMDESTDL